MMPMMGGGGAVPGSSQLGPTTPNSGGLDMMQLLQLLKDPMAMANMGPAQPGGPMSAEMQAVLASMTNGGQQPPTVSQTPGMLELLKMLQGGGGMPGGMPGGMMGGMPGGAPMGMPAAPMGY